MFHQLIQFKEDLISISTLAWVFSQELNETSA